MLRKNFKDANRGGEPHRGVLSIVSEYGDAYVPCRVTCVPAESLWILKTSISRLVGNRYAAKNIAQPSHYREDTATRLQPPAVRDGCRPRRDCSPRRSPRSRPADDPLLKLGSHSPTLSKGAKNLVFHRTISRHEIKPGAGY